MNTEKKPTCLVCCTPYKFPYARVGGLGVCSRACEKMWNLRVEQAKHPKGDGDVRPLPPK